uniref:Type III-B CRISPR module RAMP protein Cmr1 n=1 Tax=candidate division WOR-3 bacterium TaxID=2052148 RepID=A0A7V3ZXD2_UNCW3
MAKVEINVKFETITPLWTGDAWMENSGIRPSSLIGSLRFWFEVYRKVCKGEGIKLNDKGIPDENLDYKKFKEELSKNLKEMKDTEDFNEVIDGILKNNGISVSSRIFGCNGWKSRAKIQIESYRSEVIKKENINEVFPQNESFWIGKSLFNEKDEITVFNELSVKLSADKYWFDRYLKEFFDFYSDKIILIGGKKSFGFGFVRLSYGSSSKNNCSDFALHYFYEEICFRPKTLKDNKGAILGYSLRHYLRRRENKRNREVIFGIQGEASSVYISNFKPDEDQKLKLIIIKNPFDDKVFKEEVASVAEKLKNWLKELEDNK